MGQSPCSEFVTSSVLVEVGVDEVYLFCSLPPLFLEGREEQGWGTLKRIAGMRFAWATRPGVKGWASPLT